MKQITAIRNTYFNQLATDIAKAGKERQTSLTYENILRLMKSRSLPKYADGNAAIQNQDELKKLVKADIVDFKRQLVISESMKSPDYRKITQETRNVIAPYQNTKGIQIYLSGSVFLNESFRETTEKDMATMMPIVFGILILSLLILFRNISGVLLSLLMVVTAVGATFAVMGMLNITYNTLTSAASQVILAVGIAYSVHILLVYRQLGKMGLSRKDAAFISLVKNFRPTLMTAISTVIGFISLCTSPIAAIKGLGLTAAIGTIIAWCLSYSLLGGILGLLPNKKAKHKAISGEPYGHTEVEKNGLSPWALKVNEWLDRYKKSIIIIFSCLFIGAIPFLVRLEVNSDPFSYFKKNSEIRRGLEVIENQVGSARGIEISIDSGKENGLYSPEFLKKVDTFQQWLLERTDNNGNKILTKAISLIDIIKSVNRSLHGDDQKYYTIPKNEDAVAQQILLYTLSLPQGMNINDRMSLKLDSLRLSILWKVRQSKDALAEIQRIEHKARQMGLKIIVTGKQYLYLELDPYIVNSFMISIFSAMFFISLLLVFTFRSIFWGMLAMIPNLFPLVVGAAFVKIMGDYLDIGIVIVFSICLGIAVDDTIHFLVCYRDLLSKGKSPQYAVAEIFTLTVPALIATTVVLVASFMVFLLSTYVPHMKFGLLCSFILTIALLADLLLLPAIVLSLKTRSRKILSTNWSRASSTSALEAD